MQRFKLQHFAEAHPQHAFPSFSSLAANEIDDLRRQLCESAQLSTGTDWGDLYTHLLSRAHRVETANAQAEDHFNLAAIVSSLGLAPADPVYLLWDPRQRAVDRMAYPDLAKYFEWIWYPSSDDLAIVDASFAWTLFVDHEGELSFGHLQPSLLATTTTPA